MSPIRIIFDVTAMLGIYLSIAYAFVLLRHNVQATLGQQRFHPLGFTLPAIDLIPNINMYQVMCSSVFTSMNYNTTNFCFRDFRHRWRIYKDDWQIHSQYLALCFAADCIGGVFALTIVTPTFLASAALVLAWTVYYIIEGMVFALY